MSGLFGCWHRDGAAADAAAAARCVVHLSPHDQSGAVRTEGAIALGWKSPAYLTKSDDSHFRLPGVACVFVGRLDNRAELVQTVSSHAPIDPGCSDGTLVAATYTVFGDSFATRLHCEFSGAVFDARTNRLLLVRDRLGMRPLCYAQVGRTFLFASDAKAVLAHPAVPCALDETALADFLLYFRAHDASTRTFFRGIAALPPAHLLIATPKGITVRRYFDFDTTRTLRLRSFPAYAEAFHDVFVTAVRTRLRSPRPVAVTVSGGLDSSYIFAVAHRLIKDQPDLCPAISGFNHAGAASSPSDERAFVDALESACATSIVRSPQRAGFLARAA